MGIYKIVPVNLLIVTVVVFIPSVLLFKYLHPPIYYLNQN